jgi:hypothetical protein
MWKNQNACGTLVQKFHARRCKAAIPMSFRRISAILIALVLVGCGSGVTPSVDEAIGEWEKTDNLLPPIRLVLSKNDGHILARLRLSGVEANGTATVSDGKLRLRFPNRQDIVGEFSSKNELKLRLDASGTEFSLKKRN